MGLDYSYLLYFMREQLWDVLQSVVKIAKPIEQTSKIIFPDHVLTFPFEPWMELEGIFQYNDPEFNFMLVIYFPPDQEIWEYLRELSPERLESWSRESPLGLPIGYIYLTVVNDLNLHEKIDWDPDLVLLEFGTPGTTMSILFSESSSIRSRFEYLLEANKGICGVLNMEESGRVIWLNGRQVDEEIPNPFISPEEITRFLSDHS